MVSLLFINYCKQLLLYLLLLLCHPVNFCYTLYKDEKYSSSWSTPLSFGPYLSLFVLSHLTLPSNVSYSTI